MAYLITFSEDKSWMIANRHTDWLINQLTKNINDQDLIEFIESTTHVNGVTFFDNSDKSNGLKDLYLQLLKTEIPEIIHREKHLIIPDLKDMEELLKEIA